MLHNKKNNFYITTPIYYATARPHLGSLYSTVLADIIARWQIIQGKNVFFVTGTDEHGQKIANAAIKADMEPKPFVDQFIPFYQDTWRAYNIEYTKFMRTTDPSHAKQVQELVKKLLSQGDIYKDYYKGWYCTPCETFVNQQESPTGQSGQLPHCPSCNRTTEWLEEESYFFRLSAYQDRLLAFYKDNPTFIIPKERSNEILRFVQAGLKDLSISRTAVSWGIPFAYDESHTLYVWIEALCNYITAIGYADETYAKDFKQWWPANVQVMGKDIVRFHAIYWPAILMAADLDMPAHLLVHGWIKVNDQKMSKSLGNIIDPMPLMHAYGADTIRYFMARYLPINQDGEFSTQALERSIEADLANDLGNLLNRIILLAHKYNHIELTPASVWSAHALDLRDAAYAMIDEVTSYWSDYQIHMAYARVWHFVKQVNTYIHTQAPWKLAPQKMVEFNEVLSAAAHSLYVIGVLVWPVMPTKMSELFASLGINFRPEDSFSRICTAVWHERFMLHNNGTLFVKPIIDELTMPIEQIKKDTINQESITIQDFARVTLVVGTISNASKVEKSDKLLLLTVDMGNYGMRTVLSGIAHYYTPEQLIGKSAVFVANLQPRVLMGITSEGMLLCVKDKDGKQSLVIVNNVQNGTLLT